MYKKFTFTLVLVFGLVSNLLAQDLQGDELKSMQKSALTLNAPASDEFSMKLPEKVVRQWQDLKFGMFIHWGLYSILGRGEWAMFNEKIDAETYAQLAQQFNPKAFDAAKWASIAKNAGMRYMVLTARHHEGFALWNSPSSYRRYNSYETAAKRDFVADYTKACRAAGLKVGIYYSPMDWRFPGYFQPKELPDNAALMKKQAYGQVEELMHNYGKVDILWYDGGWLAHKGSDADAAWFWEPQKLNAMVRKLQPTVLINPRSGMEGNFVCNEGGAAVKGPILNHPWEKCLTLNKNSWGFNFKVNNMTPSEIIVMLVNTVDRGGNLLLNVGPDANGVIPQEQVAILDKVGHWMTAYGESIYGTVPGPFEPVDNLYGSVHKGSKIYIHLQRNNGQLNLPPISYKLLRCNQLDGKSVTFTQNEHGIRIETSDAFADESIITLVLKMDRRIR
jgi:alpha-L-fucosidase